MGAVVNQRPELFRASSPKCRSWTSSHHARRDACRSPSASSSSGAIPKLPAEYAWLRAYSPYDNLKRGAYPAMLVRTGLNDTQVAYWEPAKYVAKLRGLKTDDRPLLLKVNLEVGHGGASGRFDSLREIAEDDVFLLVELGLAG